jgi:sucrose phosphorylase
MKNQVQLITYVDRLGRGGLADLQRLLQSSLAGLFGGVHLLPFFYPIDGADAGFDPIDHTRVDPRLGTWDDIKALTRDVEVMADVIVNHMSADSPQFHDFSLRGSASPYNGLFLTLESVFARGATERDLLAIYRPRPGLPFTYATLKNGEKRILWTTFTAQQIDIAVEHPMGRAYLDEILRTLSANGVRMIRLDAAGYAIKRAGQSCFMMPETFAFIGDFAQRARALGIEVLVEIHAYFRRQIEIAACVDWVYDFALPPLVLHAIYFRTARCLADWLAIRPRNALTVLDTHDGIGVIDVGADGADREHSPGLVPPDQIDQLVEQIHARSNGDSRLATGAAASNLDLYQVNCTFYDALGRNDRDYLIARALQFFVPGIPQVYYVGLLAGENDLALLERTRVGRDINRRYYAPADIDAALAKPVVQDLLDLIRLRNRHPAFNGEFTYTHAAVGSLDLQWKLGAEFARLEVDFTRGTLRLTYSGASTPHSFRVSML